MSRSSPCQALVLSLALTAACGDRTRDGGCSKSSDCASDEVCNLLARQCVPDQAALEVGDDELAGTFRCTVGAPGDEMLTATVHVEGQLDGEPVTFGDALLCTLGANPAVPDAVVLQLLGARQTPGDAGAGQAVAVLLEVSSDDVTRDGTTLSVAAGALEVEPGKLAISVWVGPLDEATMSLGEPELVAVGASGMLELAGDASLGGELSGSFRLRVEPFECGAACEGVSQDEPGSLNAPCARPEQCAESTACLTFGDQGYCTAPCAGDADCAIYRDVDAACVELSATESVCALRCELPGDCPTDFSCIEVDTGLSVCAPDGLLVDDGNPAPDAGAPMTDGGAPAADPCASFPFEAQGFACGENLGGSAAAGTLYLCDAQTALAQLACEAGCFAAPLGEPDRCIGDDPCASVPYDGLACAELLDPDAPRGQLVRCAAQATVSTQACEHGCTQRDLSMDGACADDPCSENPLSGTNPDGFLCGANLSPDADPARLYLCQGQTSLGNVVCDVGCIAASLPNSCPGDDPCANLPYDGFVCGSALSPTATPNTLYECVGQSTASMTACPATCAHAGFGPEGGGGCLGSSN